jgi:hypothetical protein
MTTLDIPLRAAAWKLINQLGKTVVYTRVSVGVYNAGTSTVGVTSVPQAVKGIVEEWKQSKYSSKESYPTGLLAKSNDKIVTLAALTFGVPPKPTDRVTFDGVAYVVPENGVFTEYSGELACIYAVICRNT